MKLEDIGFYTLSDKRARCSSVDTPLYRCELILTDRCNFKCPYCRKLRKDIRGTIEFDRALNILNLWLKHNLKNVRFSGGEPTLYSGLDKLVKHCKQNGSERIAISTNGSADIEFYKYLNNCGANDFSISLDAGCCSIGEEMTGGIKGSRDKTVKNIEEISKFSYVTVGVVFTEKNVDKAIEAIEFASSLGVSDIRIISSAQYNEAIKNLNGLSKDILEKHPILKYRVANFNKGRNVRGILEHNCRFCKLVLDDIAVAGDLHFPCIIYLREGGDPIGKVSERMRAERYEWFLKHDSYKDNICRKNCLDVCIDFNDRALCL